MTLETNLLSYSFSLQVGEETKEEGRARDNDGGSKEDVVEKESVASGKVRRKIERDEKG